MATVQLANLDARLAFLALQYHLGRPGSELDSDTKQPAAHGLREVAEALEPQLRRAVASIELSERQRERLVSALAGALNELKTYPLLAPSGRGGTMPAFAATLQELFPEVSEDPDESAQLAGHLLALRRRLERASAGPGVTEAPGRSGRRRWWRFWQRDGS